MKKVVILSYFFPPCNLTASGRIAGWEKHLPNFGYYPIIITRNWDGNELTEEDRLKSSGSEIRIEKKENSEVHYVPYKSSLRDFFFINSKNNYTFKLISKFLTMFNLIFQHFFVRLIPYNNLYFHAKKYLRNNNDIKTIIISGNPFEQFYFGYLLKKEFPEINWIADYRDDWTTSEVTNVKFRKFQQFFEKRWVGTASCFTTISPYYQTKIAELVNIQGHTIYNGFDKLIENTHKTSIDSFVITYNGTLYETQNIEIFLDGLKLFIDSNPDKKIRFNLPGILFDQKQANRVLSFMRGYESHLVMTDRISKEEVIEIQKNSDLLLMVSHTNIKGVTSSKIFEYISLQKQFIVCPNDHDILEEIAIQSGLGVVLDSHQQVLEYMNKVIQGYSKQPDLEKLNKFWVKSQVARLGEVMINN